MLILFYLQASARPDSRSTVGRERSAGGAAGEGADAGGSGRVLFCCAERWAPGGVGRTSFSETRGGGGIIYLCIPICVYVYMFVYIHICISFFSAALSNGHLVVWGEDLSARHGAEEVLSIYSFSIYIYVCIYVYIYICMYIYICICICIYILYTYVGLGRTSLGPTRDWGGRGGTFYLSLSVYISIPSMHMHIYTYKYKYIYTSYISGGLGRTFLG